MVGFIKVGNHQNVLGLVIREPSCGLKQGVGRGTGSSLIIQSVGGD